MKSTVMRWVTAAARVTALLQGFEPEDVWATYEMFEDDMSTLFGTVEAAYNSAKPSLEERARKLRPYNLGPDAAAAAASSVVTVASNRRLDDEGTEQVESNRGIVREERIDNLRHEEEPLVSSKTSAGSKPYVTTKSHSTRGR